MRTIKQLYKIKIYLIFIAIIIAIMTLNLSSQNNLLIFHSGQYGMFKQYIKCNNLQAMEYDCKN